MISRLDRYLWEVTFGPHHQRVVGTLFDARKIEQKMRAQRASTVWEAEYKQEFARIKAQLKGMG